MNKTLWSDMLHFEEMEHSKRKPTTSNQVLQFKVSVELTHLQDILCAELIFGWNWQFEEINALYGAWLVFVMFTMFLGEL